jgi:DNA-directed RNA polymerase subunit H (RpoH/RPB5)
MEILNEDQIKQFMELYGLKKQNIPKISQSDVLCKLYNIELGDVVKIHRFDSIYYRLCC